MYVFLAGCWAVWFRFRVFASDKSGLGSGAVSCGLELRPFLKEGSGGGLGRTGGFNAIQA